MSWSGYITNLEASEGVMEASIWGHEGSMWASSEGRLSKITADEIKVLSGDLSNAYATGLKIAGNKCTLLRNNLDDEQSLSLVLNMKIDSEPHTVCVGRSGKAYVIVLGKPGVKVGQVLPVVYTMTDYLKKSGF